MMNRQFASFNPYIKWGAINLAILIIIVTFSGMDVFGLNTRADLKPLIQVLHSDWSKMMNASRAYEQASGKNYRSSAIAYNTLAREVIPVYQRALSDIQGVDSKTEPAIQFKSTLLKWVKERLNIYETLAKSYRSGGPNNLVLSEAISALNNSDAQRSKILEKSWELERWYGLTNIGKCRNGN